MSWLKRAHLTKDDDARFIFLWIAFNAAYACEIDEHCGLSEQKTFMAFLEKLCAPDAYKALHGLVWNTFSDNIRTLLDTPYVFQSFWDFQAGRIDKNEWEKRFAYGKKTAHGALAGGKTATVPVFSRLYTLRNQLIHGGATWNGRINRRPLRNCTELLGKIVPVVIGIMPEHPEAQWEAPRYPVVPAEG